MQVRSTARDVVALGVLAAGAALALKLVDVAAKHLAPRERRDFTSVEAVERAAGVRLLLPAYTPRTLRWPPARVVVDADPPTAVALYFAAAQGGGEPTLVIAQGLPGGDPRALAPFDGHALESRETPIEGAPATLTRLVGADGSRWIELTLSVRGRPVLLRSRGRLEELLKMAGSLHREGP